MVNPGWIYWSAKDLKNPDSNQIAAFLFATRKKEVCLLYKPTPFIYDGKFTGFIGNMFNEGSTPAIITIDGDEVGSCFAVKYFNRIPEEFCPKIPLEVNMVKDTAWENAMQDIALIALPTLVLILFGTYVESTIFNDAFMEEMNKILAEHGFWAKAMSDVFKQALLNEDSVTTAERLMSSKTSSKARDPTHAATKGIRGATVASLGPFIETSQAGKKHETEQAIVRSFFHRNPTPVRIEVINDDDEHPEVRININSANAPADENPATVQTNPVLATLPTILPGEVQAIPGGVPPEFYTQLIETMKIMQVVQAPQAIPKIVVESRNHEESVDLAKLQISMLQLMYAGGDIDWEEGTVKNVQLADFVQGFIFLADPPRSRQLS
jgi:hypothetical protein